MKHLLTVLCVVLAGLAVWGLLSARQETAHARALRAQLDSTRLAYGVDSARWAQERTALEADRARLAQEGSRLARTVVVTRDSARQALGTLAALLAARGDDSTGAVLATVEDAFAACDEANAGLAKQLDNCEHRVVLADSQAAANQRLSARYELAWQNAEARARPNFFRDVWRAKGMLLPLLALVGVLVVTN